MINVEHSADSLRQSRIDRIEASAESKKLTKGLIKLIERKEDQALDAFINRPLSKLDFRYN